MKIVFLDQMTIGDFDRTGFEQLGEVVTYPTTDETEIDERVENADILVVNKVKMNAATLKNASKCRLICVTATGTDHLDKDYLKSRGIAWRNAAGYSTESVAQHTFAMLFYLEEKLKYYDDYVKSEEYIRSPIFTNCSQEFHQISGKTWGMIGLGAIGRRVAEIAKVFGCRVIYYSTSGKNDNRDYERVSLERLLKESDIVSVHAPLNQDTEGLMDKKAFDKMKPSAIFMNLGRGPIVVEKDLAEALENGKIAAAGLDVLSVEPMSEKNPLKNIKDSRKLLITPHIAWASMEARKNLMKIVEDEIRTFITVQAE